MKEFDYILKKFNLQDNGQRFIEIPNTTREDLGVIFRELGYKTGAEIGTLKGDFAEFLCQTNEGVKLYAVDSYVAYRGYREHRVPGELEGYEEEARKKLAPFNVEFIKEFSMDAVKRFKANSLDFVYIDGNHAFKQVVDDIAEWYARIRPGGIISGHDYIKHKESHGLHVVQAVQGYTDSYGIRPYFVLGEKDSKEGDSRDRFRSWFWIKR